MAKNHDLEGVIHSEDRKTNIVYNPNARFMSKPSVVESLTVPVRQTKPVSRRNVAPS